MVDKLSNFINWAQAQMNAKNITQADIARTGYVTTAAVSKLFTYQVKSVGVEMCKAIAEATGIPLETVYRKAGLLPPINLTEAEQEQIASLTSGLDEDLRQSAIEFLEHLTQKQSARRTAHSNNNAH